ncbi:MAG: UDP-N-acetylenolpyruvoylglucosamine reductase [Lentisphaerae bacterium ADurb.Bin082]|nr:MAG: UDP-N-acetylenolpyruvoylglucosamine reductase [Lentisphaerae bacterium ADurb.Bin082]
MTSPTQTAFLDDSIQPWSSLCSLRAGLGMARVLEPVDLAALRAVIASCPQPLCVLGRGTNVVGSDDDGLVVLRLPARGDFAAITRLEDGCFEVGAGIGLSRLLAALAKQGFGGAAALSGIPGALGGALAMNAGARGQEISANVLAMQGLDCRIGREWRWTEGEGGWGYRTSPIPPEVIVTQATLRFDQVRRKEELDRISAERARRRKVTPAGFSAGSVFRNPAPELPAGRLLEQAGCKGMREGVFAVSEAHANWIVNANGTPGAAADCRRLADRMVEAVVRRSGVTLHSEWRWVT